MPAQPAEGRADQRAREDVAREVNAEGDAREPDAEREDEEPDRRADSGPFGPEGRPHEQHREEHRKREAPRGVAARKGVVARRDEEARVNSRQTVAGSNARDERLQRVDEDRIRRERVREKPRHRPEPRAPEHQPERDQRAPSATERREHDEEPKRRRERIVQVQENAEVERSQLRKR